MAILRKHLSKGFTQIPDATLRDERLSFKATGLLAVMLSHADGWDISAKALSGGKTDGVEATRTGLRELADAGYYYRDRCQNADGTWRMEIHVSDVAIPEWVGRDLQVGAAEEAECEATESRGTEYPVSRDSDAPDSSLGDQDLPTEDRGDQEDPQPPPPDGDGSPSQQAEEVDPAGLPSQLELVTQDGSEAAPRVLSRSEQVAEITGRLVQVWGEATGRERAHKVTADRKRKVSARLRDGFTEADLEEAIRGMALDSYLRQNDKGVRYDTFEIAVRDGERVERYREAWREHLEHGPRRERVSGGQSATDRAMDIIAGRS